MMDDAPRKRRGKQTRAEINAVQRRYRRKWRQTYPDKDREARLRERPRKAERQRERYAALTDDERLAAMDRLNAYTAQQQAESLATATNTGTPYTDDEDEIVVSGKPDRIIARELGRTLQSVRARRKILTRHERASTGDDLTHAGMTRKTP